MASFLTWPTLPSLPLLDSRALRHPWRQLFRWVWVSLSLAFVRFFSLLVPRRPLSRAPAPFRSLPPSTASLPRLYDHSDTTQAPTAMTSRQAPAAQTLMRQAPAVMSARQAPAAQSLPAPTDVWPANLRDRYFASTCPSFACAYCARQFSSS